MGKIVLEEKYNWENWRRKFIGKLIIIYYRLVLVVDVFVIIFIILRVVWRCCNVFCSVVFFMFVDVKFIGCLLWILSLIM